MSSQCSTWYATSSLIYSTFLVGSRLHRVRDSFTALAGPEILNSDLFNQLNEVSIDLPTQHQKMSFWDRISIRGSVAPLFLSLTQKVLVPPILISTSQSVVVNCSFLMHLSKF